MKKGILRDLGRTARKRVKRLSTAAAQTAEELLQKSYVGAAEQTLRGAETMTTILHEPDADIAKAKSAFAGKRDRKKAKKKPKRAASKRSARRRRRA